MPLGPIEKEVVHPGRPEQAIVLGQEDLGRDMGHELREVDILLHAIAPDAVVGVIDLPQPVVDREVEHRIGFFLVVLRLEAVFVGCEILAEVFTPPLTLQLVGIEVAVVLAEVAREELRCRPIRG